MNDNDFSPDFWQRLEDILKNTPPPLHAAFDADGTLWDSDVGESFFQFLIEDKKLSTLTARDWDHYLELKKRNPEAAYYLLAQVFDGLPLKQVYDWSWEHIDKMAPPVFASQQKLIDLLKKQSVLVWVVTASVSWAIQPACLRFFGIPFEHVLGVETYITPGGVITNIPRPPCTYKEGKAQALLQRTQNVPPILAMGNAESDRHFMELAKLPVAIQSSAKQPGLKDSEERLAVWARQQGWLTHSFLTRESSQDSKST